MDTSNITIETKNLYLQSINLQYKDNFFQEFTSKITTFMVPKPAETIQNMIDFIEQSIRENIKGRNFQIVIIDKISKEFLGCGGLHHIDRKTPELRIWIKKSSHGHGFGKDIPKEAEEFFETYACNMGEDFVILNIDNIRFTNHSDKPNSKSLGPYRDNIALRDIHIGEEITIDYNEIDVDKIDFQIN